MSLIKPVSKKKPHLTGIFSVSYTRKGNQGARKRDPKTREPRFRSEFEKEFWDANKGKIPLQYEPYKIHYSYTYAGKYLPDFVTGRSDAPVVYETKGRWMSKDRTKLKAVLASNPGLTVIMVFQRNNTLTKISKTRYSDWCQKHGIPYVVGTDISKVVYPRSALKKPLAGGTK